jgi:hypothetical protein
VRTAGWAMAILAAALAGTATAQDAPAPPRPDRWQQVVECRRETNDKARLACMDAAIAALEAAEANHEVVVVDRRRVEREDRKRFGLPRRESVAEESTRPIRPPNIRKYEASVLQTFQSSFLHEWIFWLSDGSVWRQHGDEEIYRKPHKGSTVEISRGLLGNFFLVVDRGFAIPVNRIR